MTVPSDAARRRISIAAIAPTLALLLAACSGSQPVPPPPQPTPTLATASPTSSPVSAAGIAAEQVHSVVGDHLTADEEHYGAGTKSPCSTSSPQMFTAQCAQAAVATAGDAALALAEIHSRAGFATLTAAARSIDAAVHTYQRLGCSTNPASDTTRHACLAPAATIAQGFPALRDGINLALGGK